MNKIPGQGYHTDTPSTANMIKLLGPGGWSGSVAFSKDQVRRLMKAYGFKEDRSHPLAEQGTFRNLVRHTERDGLRVMAFLSRYLQPGQDPVKLVAQLCSEAGFDVPNDIDWIYEEDGPPETVESHHHPL